MSQEIANRQRLGHISQTIPGDYRVGKPKSLLIVSQSNLDGLHYTIAPTI